MRWQRSGVPRAIARQVLQSRPRSIALEAPRDIGLSIAGTSPMVSGRWASFEPGLAQEAEELRGQRLPGPRRRDRRAMVMKQLCRRRAGDQPPLAIQQLHPVDQGQQPVEAMIDEEGAGAGPLGHDPLDQPIGLERRCGIEMRRRLVEEMDRRLLSQGRGEQQLLLLPAGEESAGALAPGAGQADAIERDVDAGVDLRRRQSAVLQGEGNLILDGQGAELAVGILKDEGDGLGPGARRLPPTARPASSILPAMLAGTDWGMMPLRQSARLVLPQPEGPSSRTRSPGIDAEREIAQRGTRPKGMGEGQAFDLDPGPAALMPPGAWRHRCPDLAARRWGRAPRRCAVRASPPEARRWRCAGRTSPAAGSG